MEYLFFARTDCGRVRKNNEDAVATAPEIGLALLADGMGGYNAGEVASNMAISITEHAMARWFAHAGTTPTTSDVRKALQESVQEANLAVLNTALQQPQCAGMGTTLVAAVFVQDRLVLGHMGDSRCYRLRDGQLQQITRDHSLVSDLVENGTITQEQARTHPRKNVLMRAVGVEE